MVWNRLNPSQLEEQYLNFMADHVVEEMKATDNYEEKMQIFLSFLQAVNEKEYDYFDIEQFVMNRQQRIDFIDKIEQNGIYIHQPPFFGNTTEEQFKEIYKNHPEWCTEYKFKGIEKPMVMGDVYFIKLKHEPGNKNSMRSAANLNVKNLPAKSTLKKEKKIAYSKNPLRLGRHFQLAEYKPYICGKFLRALTTNLSH